MSLSCVLQLTSGLDLIDPDSTEHDARTSITHRLHDLQLYASDHWCDHLLALSSVKLSSSLTTNELQHLCQGIERLAHRHNALAQHFETRTPHEHRVLAGRINSLDFLDISSSSRLLIENALCYRQKLSSKGVKVAEKALGECCHGNRFKIKLILTVRGKTTTRLPSCSLEAVLGIKAL